MPTPYAAAVAAVRVATNTAVGVLAGAPLGTTAAIVVGAVGALLGTAHAAAVVRTDSYPTDARGLWLFVLDHTWSLPNTVAGSAFLALNLALRNTPDPERSRHRSTVVMREGLLPGFATTIGNVEAGTSRHIAAHEYVHVLQARLFGPAYLPLVLAGFAAATLLPFWLAWHDHAARPIRSVRDYFLRGVYPHTWHEEWAYAVEGTPP